MKSASECLFLCVEAAAIAAFPRADWTFKSITVYPWVIGFFSLSASSKMYKPSWYTTHSSTLHARYTSKTAAVFQTIMRNEYAIQCKGKRTRVWLNLNSIYLSILVTQALIHSSNTFSSNTPLGPLRDPILTDQRLGYFVILQIY